MKHARRFLLIKLHTTRDMNKGAKAVGEAITGLDFITVVVCGKAYTVLPPTINRIAGAAKCLSGVREANTLREILLTLEDTDRLAKALSWFINDDEAMADELGEGRPEELVDALEDCLSMVSIKVFLRAVSLARSVSLLAAKPR